MKPNMQQVTRVYLIPDLPKILCSSGVERYTKMLTDLVMGEMDTMVRNCYDAMSTAFTPVVLPKDCTKSNTRCFRSMFMTTLVRLELSLNKTAYGSFFVTYWNRSNAIGENEWIRHQLEVVPCVIDNTHISITYL